LKVRPLKDGDAGTVPRLTVLAPLPDIALFMLCVTVTGFRMVPPAFPIFREGPEDARFCDLAAGLLVPEDVRFREVVDGTAALAEVDPVCRFNMDLAPA